MCAVTINIWPGSGSAITPGSGSTPFGFFDSDSEFQSEAPKVADWCAKRLGYPVVDVELRDTQMYACFEEAICEYSNQVNQFNIKQNMLKLQGVSTGSNLTHKNITTGVQRIIKLSETYGNEVLVGGDIDLKRGYVDLAVNQQVYDLNLVAKDSASNAITSSFEVKRMFHFAPPAIARYFDPFAGTGMGTYSMLSEFGWTNYSVGTSFMMLPIYADILRIQSIEFNEQVRKSGYSFEIINNKLRIFPIPTSAFKVWFDYVSVDDQYSVLKEHSTGTTSDMSNAPFDLMAYSDINSVGKQWIRNYTVVLCKEVLGNVRGKYSSIPYSNDETLQMNATDLKSEVQQEKTALIEQLRETLEEMTRRKQLEKEAEEAENLQKVLNKIPLKIYIG